MPPIARPVNLYIPFTHRLNAAMQTAIIARNNTAHYGEPLLAEDRAMAKGGVPGRPPKDGGDPGEPWDDGTLFTDGTGLI